MLFRVFELPPMIEDVRVEYLARLPACQHDARAKGCYKSQGTGAVPFQWCGKKCIGEIPISPNVAHSGIANPPQSLQYRVVCPKSSSLKELIT
jgi:hypothetical protein